MDPITRFQLQVLRSWKVEELRAKKKVKHYQALIEQSKRLNAGQDRELKYSLESAQGEVKLYRRLIASALKKARNAGRPKKTL